MLDEWNVIGRAGAELQQAMGARIHSAEGTWCQAQGIHMEKLPTLWHAWSYGHIASKIKGSDSLVRLQYNLKLPQYRSIDLITGPLLNLIVSQHRI